MLLLAMVSCKGDLIEGNSPSRSSKLDWPSGGLSIIEYTEWINDSENGFVRNKVFDALHFQAKYIPSELKAIRSLGVEAENFEKRKHEAELFRELEFYEIILTVVDHNDELLNYQLATQEEYQRRVQYFGFYANQDAQIICGEDTISCPHHTWERTYDAVNKVVLEFAFPANSLTNCEHEQRELIYNDSVFGNGPIHFRF